MDAAGVARCLNCADMQMCVCVHVCVCVCVCVCVSAAVDGC